MACHQVDAQGSFFFTLTPEAPSGIDWIVCSVNLLSEDSVERSQRSSFPCMLSQQSVGELGGD